MLVAEVVLDGCRLWFGAAVVDTMFLQRGSADVDIGCCCATPVQSQAETAWMTAASCAEHAVFAG